MIDDELDLYRWSVPFYLKFLHANFMRPFFEGEEPKEQWNERLRAALRDITPEIAGDLLTHENWRAKLPGAWFCGLKRWDDFTLDIGRLLVKAQHGIMSQGYSFALARFASHASASFLRTHLDRVIKKTLKTEDNSDWLIGALMWIDAKLGTAHADDYIGLWQMEVNKLFEAHEGYGAEYRASLTEAAVREKFWRIMAYVEEHFD